jgi:N-acetylmuramoyl-L-alanine amidase
MASKKIKIIWLSASSLVFIIGIGLASIKLFFPNIYAKLNPVKPVIPIYKNDGRIRIVLDAGHGGLDPGAINKKLNIYEKNLCRQIVDALLQNADTAKYYIIETRPLDSNMHRHDRILAANYFKPDLLLSIHNNSFITPKLDGTEISYADSSLNVLDSSSIPNPHKAICIEISDSLSKHIGYVFPNMTNRGIRVRKDRIWMIYAGNFPSILIEFGYISNPKDIEVMKDPLAQQLLAKAIWYSVDGFFAKHPIRK